MMPPVSANHPLKHRRQRRRRADIDSTSKETPSSNSGASSTEASYKAVPAAAPSSKEVRGGSSATKEHASKKSMDPPAALDPADLLAELSKFDNMNIGIHHGMNTDNMNDSHSGSHILNGSHPSASIGDSNGSHPSVSIDDSNRSRGSYSDLYSLSGSEAAPSASQTTIAMPVPAKQQLDTLRSKYFQPKSSSRSNRQQRPPPQARPHPQSRGSSGLVLNRSSTTAATESITENSLRRYSASASTVEGAQGAISGGGGGVSANDVIHSIGTYSIPTFKDKESDRLRHSRTKLKTYGMIGGDGSRDNRLSLKTLKRTTGNSDDNNNGNGSRGRNPFLKEMRSMDMDPDDTLNDNDNWMEEALLHGIPAANKGAMVEHDEPTNIHINRGTGAPSDIAMGGSGPDSNNKSVDQLTNYSKKQLLGKLLTASEISLNSHPPASQQQGLLMAQSDLSASERISQAPSSGQGQRRGPVRFNRSISSGAPTHHLENNVKSDSGDGKAARRITISDLTNPSMSMEDLIKNHARTQDTKQDEQHQLVNHRATVGGLSSSRSPSYRPRRHRHAPSPPPDALSNIPVLPTINTYKVTKNRPDEPAGLFLTKSKNGAVLVHSLSPESLFRKSTPLHPGQEVLSVNEKRVNDPKMAATLITQAKRNLSLRISTVERSRGFMYCQVKRRSGGAKAGAVDTNAAAGTATGGTKGEDGNAGKSSAAGAGSTAIVTAKTAAATGTEGRKRGRGPSGPSHHGVRFVTTSVDGVRRSTITEGLVRVSHIDPQGLFANSHPMNRLRVGSIVLTVNGTPVTNGRTALEKVMGSRQLVEVLHCDEKVWREDWVKDGLEQVLSGRPQKDPKEITSSIFAKKETENNTNNGGEVRNNNKVLNDSMWDLEWNSEKEEVTLRKKGRRGSTNYAFKLIFNNDVGTCHPELVDEDTMMPPTDEFDVSLLVKMVNDSQRTMMTVLQNMLRRAKFELKFGSGALVSRHTVADASSLQIYSKDAVSNANEHQIVKRREPCDILTELVEDEHGGVNEELCQLANSLLRVDSRDQQRNTLRASQLRLAQDASIAINKQKIPRRGSTGVSEDIDGISSAEIEQWRLEQWENQPTTNTLREFSARQHKMEEQYNHSHSNDANAEATEASLAGSMFSADMLEDFLDYLEDVDAAHGSVATPSNLSQEEGDEGNSSHNDERPPSPRDDANKWEDGALRISPTQQSSSDDETSPSENKGDDEMAYITGVWRDVGFKYKVSDKIVGSGGFGEVRDCYDKKTGQIYVVKTIFKPSQDDTTKINLIRNEILLLHEAHHPNIVELRDLFEDDKYVHIVMERCTGGDLFDRVVAENPRKLRSPAEATKHEGRTANSMRSILHVIKYLHSKGIVHRDIKPEHFLLTTDERETQKIKLIDFGLARKHKPGSSPMTTFTGSPSFVAPEVIARKYDHMCDMFSVGVTAYFMLTGMLPFDGPTDEETFDLISVGEFRFPPSSVFLSDDAKDFITKLLQTDPSRRMSAFKALNHPWLLKAASC